MLVSRNDAIDNIDKPYVLLKNFYPDLQARSFFELRLMPVEQTLEFINQMNWFIRGGEPEIKTNNKPVLVCFEQDASHIYSAFLKKGINLDKELDMHFWTWKSHFSELPESFLTRLIYLRNKMRSPKGLDKDEKKECAEIGWDIVNIKIGAVDMAGNIDIWSL